MQLIGFVLIAILVALLIRKLVIEHGIIDVDPYDDSSSDPDIIDVDPIVEPDEDDKR